MMTGGSSLVLTACDSVASGRSTSTLWVMMGAVAIKISSSTSSTSSNGTILISDLSSRRPRPRDLAMVYPLLLSVLVNA
ncbi:Uncharacterised protein [Enterobacter cloacae]|nr:Uncharacterised protein [Enterobacter cloacae]